MAQMPAPTVGGRDRTMPPGNQTDPGRWQAAVQGRNTPEPPHGAAWWWLHDHLGINQTRHEKAENLRQAMGAQSGAAIIGPDGQPINVEQLSDDEVIELDKKLRGLPVGAPYMAGVTPVMTT